MSEYVYMKTTNLKTLRLLCAFIAIISSSAFANEKTEKQPTTPVWTEEAYTKLSPNEKVQFLEDFRNVLVLMDQKSEYFADATNPRASGWKSISQLMITQSIQAAPVDNSLTDDQIMKNAKNALTVYKVSNFTEASNAAYNEFKSRLTEQTELDSYQAVRATRALTYLTAEAQNLKGSNDPKKLKDLEDKFAQMNKEIATYKIPEAYVGSLNKLNSAFYRITKSKSPGVSYKTASGSKKSVDQNWTLDKDFKFSACLYAGFVVSASVCRAPKKLDNLDSLNDFLDAKTFKCDSSHEVICNPLLFGYSSDCPLTDDPKKKYALPQTAIQSYKTCLKTAKPVCVQVTSDATASCRQKTKDPKFNQRALDLISLNPKMLVELVGRVNQLCDPSTARENSIAYEKADGTPRPNSAEIIQDIQRTCVVVNKKMTEINDKYLASTTSTTKPTAIPSNPVKVTK